MSTRNRSNLDSPSAISTPCDPQNLDDWFEDELFLVRERAHAQLIRDVVRQLDEFVRWPAGALLLWDGCTRERDYHSYPPAIKSAAKATGVVLDARANGPATAAFVLAGGARPTRFGSANAWSSHHLYSGKFPHPGTRTSLHAKYERRHFTQSAGIVAVHPVADALCDEYPAFSWLLRAHACLRFGYDPDGVLVTGEHDLYGFAPGRSTEVLHVDVATS